MSKKLNKYANLYDKEGNLIRHIDENTGKLEDYTMEELEELVDKLANDKDENGKVKDPVGLNNANWILTHYYQKYGNPHIAEWIEEWKKQQQQKSTDEQIEEKLREIQEEVESLEDNKSLEGTTQSKQAEGGLLVDNTHAKNNQFTNNMALVDENPDEIVSQVETNLNPEYVDFEQIEKNELYDKLNEAA